MLSRIVSFFFVITAAYSYNPKFPQYSYPWAGNEHNVTTRQTRAKIYIIYEYIDQVVVSILCSALGGDHNEGYSPVLFVFASEFVIIPPETIVQILHTS